MPSYDVGKDVITKWVRDHFDQSATILDVGACDGKWQKLLPEYAMDAVEIWESYCRRIKPIYRNVFHCDVADLTYEYYDLIIFGDVIEHMSVEKAQRVLEYAYDRCRDMIVAVPYMYAQGELDGNPWQAHEQPDLTAIVMSRRYPMLKVLHDTGAGYCYYKKKRRTE